MKELVDSFWICAPTCLCENVVKEKIVCGCVGKPISGDGTERYLNCNLKLQGLFAICHKLEMLLNG